MKTSRLLVVIWNLAFALSLGQISGQPAAQIKGVVRGPQGILLKDVTLYLLSLERARKTKTDENGNFEFLDLPTATYELEVRQLGAVQPAGQEISISEPGVREVSIVLQVSTSECFPKIQAAYEDSTDRGKLVGNVAEYSSERTPVKDAAVAATHLETGTTHVVSTDEKGDYQFVGLPPGKYALKISHRAYSDKVGIDFWVTRANLTRLPPIYIFKKDEHLVIICQ